MGDIYIYIYNIHPKKLQFAAYGQFVFVFFYRAAVSMDCSQTEALPNLFFCNFPFIVPHENKPKIEREREAERERQIYRLKQTKKNRGKDKGR